jgi:hypothetical protein
MSMKSLFRCIVIVALTVSVSIAQNTAPTTWKSFKSSTGFSVKYPDSWFPKGISKDRLTILSSRGGAEALIITGGQAVISVMEADGSEGSSLAQVIDHYSHDVHILSSHDIHNDNVGSQGCRELREIISTEAAVPPEDVPGPVPYIINTEYFCAVNEHIYVTALRNFDGDNKQAAYQRVALRVAESLRKDE